MSISQGLIIAILVIIIVLGVASVGIIIWMQPGCASEDPPSPPVQLNPVNPQALYQQRQLHRQAEAPGHNRPSVSLIEVGEDGQEIVEGQGEQVDTQGEHEALHGENVEENAQAERTEHLQAEVVEELEAGHGVRENGLGEFKGEVEQGEIDGQALKQADLEWAKTV